MLVINWPAWYLMAYDHLRNEPRTFRLDRSTAVVVEPDAFRPRPLAIARELLDAPGLALGRV